MGDDNRATLERMLDAMMRSDWDTFAATMADDAVVEYPQSGEMFVGRQACLNVFRNYPGGSPQYELKRISGGPDVYVIEATGDYSGEIVHLASIVEFRDGKIAKQTDYWANAFEAPAWRSEWVQHVDKVPVG